MISKSAVISQLQRIERKELDHHEILVIAHGILNVLDDVEGVDSYWLAEIELYLRMLTKRAPHHAKSLQARQCIEYLRKGGESKKSQESSPMTPDNF